MKLAVFADLHLDTPFKWAGSAAGRRRRQGLREALSRIVEIASHEADALLCAGDLYEHERYSADSGEFLRETFESLSPKPVLLAPGNHDFFGPGSLYRRVEWSPNVHVFSEPTLESFELEDGLNIWGAAHQAPRGTEGFLDRFSAPKGEVNLALFHGTERGGLPFQADGKEPHAPFDACQVPASGLDHAFVGHFHKPVDAAWHTYPGNPEPLAFGEPDHGSLVLATVSGDGAVECQRRPVAGIEMHDVQVDISTCRSGTAVQRLVVDRLTGLRGYARVTVAGELQPDIDLVLDDLRSVSHSLDALVVRFGPLHIAYDVDSIAEQATVEGQFVRDVLASDLDENEKQRVIATGLRALSSRTDLEVA